MLNSLKKILPLFILPVLMSCQQEARKPNVLILFSDQHQKKTMAYENHPDVITPNLDKLASESLVFDRAYATVGVCVPSRMSLMSGLYPRTFGALSNNDRSSVIEDAVSMATIFKANGYNTYTFGKRHLKGAIDEGWDVKKEHALKPDDDDNYVAWIDRQGYADEFASDWAAEFGKGPDYPSGKRSKMPTADLGTRMSQLPEEFTMEAYTTKETIQMIKEQSKSDKPFFCWATFYRPHQPYNPLPKYMAMYDVTKWGKGTKLGSGIKKPASLYQSKETLPPLLQFQRNGGNKVWNMDKAFENEQLWRDYIGAYYALVTEIDHHVGEIIEALEAEGIRDETLIIYTSDHGDFVGNHGMVEKCAAGQNVYEDILNIPLIIHYKGKTKAGKRTSELVTLADILPTLIDWLDLQTPEFKYSPQGKSMVNLIEQGKSMNRDYLVSESWSQATVITKDYKLGIMLDPTDHYRRFDYRDFGDMFFARASDPLELENQINNPEYSHKISELRKMYDDFGDKVSDIGKKEVIENYSK